MSRYVKCKLGLKKPCILVLSEFHVCESSFERKGLGIFLKKKEEKHCKLVKKHFKFVKNGVKV